MPELLRDAIDFLGYWGIGLLMIVVAPEVVMPLAGFLAGEGRLSPVGVVLVGSTGAVSGLVALYVLGRRLGEERVRAFMGRYGRWVFLTDKDFDSVVRAFRTRGPALVLFGRLLPTVRSVISVPAGLVAMPFWRYLVLTALGTAVWNALLVGAAFSLAAQRERLLAVLDAYELAVTLGVVVLVAVVILRRLRARLLPGYSGEAWVEGPGSPAGDGPLPPGAHGPEPQGSTRSNRMS